MHIKGQYKEVISSVNVVAGTFYVASYVSYYFLYFVYLVYTYHLLHVILTCFSRYTLLISNRFQKKDIQKVAHALLRIFLLRRFVFLTLFLFYFFIFLYCHL